MSRIKIGAASWHEIATYYPPGRTSSGDKLRFYSAEFPLVELDTSYYGIPAQRVSSAWVEHTPEAFTFDVKAFRLFTTHQTPPRFLPRNIRDELPSGLAEKRTLYYKEVPASLKDQLWGIFEEMLDPIHSAGKLGLVVFQFPHWFMPRKESFSHIEECKERMSKYRMAVEFRNRYWLQGDSLEETLGFLRHNGISFVAVDEPQGFNSSVPPVADVTGELGIVRFHGRNRDTWEKKGLKSSSERFDHYYSQDEMEEWAPRIATMKRDAEEVHVIMNTNNQDQAIVNARLAGKVLGEGLKKRPTLF